MANRTWGRLLLTALGLSVLAGAGQLGIAYGFGIVRLTGEFTDGSVNRWPAQLVWVSWFAALAAVTGALLTERLARREELPAETTEQLAVAGAAALGATVVAPLCMQPARAAELLSVDPVWAVGICAVLGAVIGAGAALTVLLRPPLGWNVAVLAGVVWLLALISAAPSLVGSGPLPTVRLGVLEPAGLAPDTAERLALLILPVVALVSGAVTGGLARRRGHPPLVSGATGAAGPALIAFAYLSAGPGDSVDRYQLAPYYAALIALATGVLGSTAAALLRWPLLPAGRTGAWSAEDAVTPTAILRPLPAGTGLPAGAPPAPAPGDDRASLVAGDARDGFRATAGGGHADLFASAPPAGSTPPHWDWPATGTDPDAAPARVASAAIRSDRPATDVPATGTDQPPVTGLDPARTADPDRSPAAEPGGAEVRPATAPADPSAAAGSGTPADGVAGAVAATGPGAAATAGPPRRPRRTRRPADPAAAAATTPTAGTETPTAATTPTAGADAPTAATAGPEAVATTGTEATATRAAGTAAATAPEGTTEATGPTPTAKRARRRTAGAPANGADAAGAPATGANPAGDQPPAMAGSPSPATAEPVTPPTPPPSDATAAKPGATAAKPGATAGEPAGEPEPATGTPATPRPRRTRTSRATTTGAPPTGGGPAAPGAPEAAPLDPAGAVSGAPLGPAPAPATPVGSRTEPAATTRNGPDATTLSGPDATTPSGPDAAAAEPAATAPAGEPPATPTGGDRTATPGTDPVEAPPPDEERRGPVPAWPGAPVRPAPLGRTPLTGPVGRGTPPEERDRAARPDGVEPTTPRPRHRAPLPDLDRAGSWDAFGNGFRRTAPLEPAPAAPPTPAPAEEPAVPRQPDGSREPAAPPASEKARPKRGLFRRNRSRAVEPDRPPVDEPLPAPDEEYVDWVTGLAKEAPEPEAEEPGRRSLRSTGRHHRD
ncbi:hypothetical protein K7640_19790 [Micromonospora sp. PLK6-60]|uniref:hypothetical protein n=1 Tax=Micromonospora sp. PLK6-60 TaxID=2873383 RepID=UPI001CA686D8|nr:hypothetical protein [Micromonospora sp. PLK6-60]MBY8874072.1 hypothetical protein [Micromonospora sp. PLK6-60]